MMHPADEKKFPEIDPGTSDTWPATTHSPY